MNTIFSRIIRAKTETPHTFDDANVLFEDKYLAIVLKKCGDDSQTFFKEYFAAKEYAQAVNRLDQPVSGLLVLAFHPEIHTTMNYLFQNSKVKKEYLAICKKNGRAEIGKTYFCEDYITYNSFLQKGFVTAEKRKAKRAAMYRTVIGQGENYIFLHVSTVTGRMHQIRVQLSNAGFPIKGDIKYGAKRTEKGGGIRLHAYSLRFLHPITNESLYFSALPPHADNLWDACIKAYSRFSAR